MKLNSHGGELHMEFEALNAVIGEMNGDQRHQYFCYPGREAMSESEMIALAQNILAGKIKESNNMKDLYSQLATKLETMSESQHTAFVKQAKGRSVEAKMAIAESVLKNTPREPKKIVRNNGNGWAYVDVRGESNMHEADRKLFESMGMTSEQVERAVSDGLPKEIRESNDARVVADYKFLRAINLTEAQAVAGALKNTLRK